MVNSNPQWFLTWIRNSLAKALSSIQVQGIQVSTECSLPFLVIVFFFFWLLSVCFVLFFNPKETYSHFWFFIFLCWGRGSRRLKGESFCARQFMSKRIQGEAEGERESVLVALFSSDIVSSTCLLVSCRKVTLSFSLLEASRYQSK